MKTKVKIIADTKQCNIKKGDYGYIDGYMTANNSPYVIIVSSQRVDLVPFYALKPIPSIIYWFYSLLAIFKKL